MSTIYMMMMYWSKTLQYQNRRINTYISVCIDLWNKLHMLSIKTIRTNYYEYDLNDNDALILNIVII